ncbi:MAG: gluconate 2-dehydrogenase subunit 3 family protein [Bacteroidota bacterium]
MKRRDAIKQTALIMGYAVSASAISGVLAGCQATGGMDWTPVYLSKDQGTLLAEIAEIIIPASDTPGAKDVFVHEFIDTMIGKYLKAEEGETLKAGLAQVDADAQAAHGKKFMSCTPEQQTALLVKMADDTQAAMEADPSLRKNKPFFVLMKELTMLGYFTSEVVGKEIFSFDPVPGEYGDCIPVEEVKNSWTI